MIVCLIDGFMAACEGFKIIVVSASFNLASFISCNENLVTFLFTTSTGFKWVLRDGNLNL